MKLNLSCQFFRKISITLVVFAIGLMVNLCGADEAADDMPPDMNVVNLQRIVGGRLRTIPYGESIDFLRDTLLQCLAEKMKSLDWKVQLTQHQWISLDLAGRGDIKHHLDEVDSVQTILRDRTVDAATANIAEDRRRELVETVRGRLFERGSFFAKVQRRILNDRQQAVLAQENWLAAREGMACVFARILKLPPDRAELFEQFVIKEIPPPTQAYSSALDYLRSQLANVPLQRFEGILDNEEFQRLKVESSGSRIPPVEEE